MPMLQGRAGQLAYFDNTPVAVDAPVVMLLHSSAASSQQWRKLTRELTPRYRVLAPDLIGYGGTPMTAASVAMADEVALLTELAEQIAKPIHLVGHSYGGAVALHLARAIPHRLASLALYEPVMFHLLAGAGHGEAWSEIAAMAQRQISQVAQGDLAGAAVGFIDYWIGKGALLAMPEEKRHYIVTTMTKVAAELRLIFEPQPATEDFTALRMPMLLMAGENTTRAARAVAEVLRGLLPGAEWRLEPGWVHMAPVLQPDRFNPQLTAFLDRVSGLSPAAQPALRRGAA